MHGALDTKTRTYFKEEEALTLLNVMKCTSKMGWGSVHRCNKLKVIVELDKNSDMR